MHELDNINTLPENFELSVDFIGNIEDLLTDTEEKLQALGEELRLKLQLAQMDTEDFRHDLLDTVTKLEKKMRQYARDIEGKLEHTEVQAHLGFLEAKELWEITKEHSQKLVDLLKDDPGKAKNFFDEVKLKTALAKLETKDFIKESRKELSQEAKELRKQSQNILKNLNQGVTDLLKRLSE